jgi:hypothetical protein
MQAHTELLKHAVHVATVTSLVCSRCLQLLVVLCSELGLGVADLELLQHNCWITPPTLLLAELWVPQTALAGHMK